MLLRGSWSQLQRRQHDKDEFNREIGEQTCSMQHTVTYLTPYLSIQREMHEEEAKYQLDCAFARRRWVWIEGMRTCLCL